VKKNHFYYPFPIPQPERTWTIVLFFSPKHTPSFFRCIVSVHSVDKPWNLKVYKARIATIFFILPVFWTLKPILNHFLGQPSNLETYGAGILYHKLFGMVCWNFSSVSISFIFQLPLYRKYRVKENCIIEFGIF